MSSETLEDIKTTIRTNVIDEKEEAGLEIPENDLILTPEILQERIIRLQEFLFYNLDCDDEDDEFKEEILDQIYGLNEAKIALEKHSDPNGHLSDIESKLP